MALSYVVPIDNAVLSYAIISFNNFTGRGVVAMAMFQTPILVQNIRLLHVSNGYFQEANSSQIAESKPGPLSLFGVSAEKRKIFASECLNDISPVFLLCDGPKSSITLSMPETPSTKIDLASPRVDATAAILFFLFFTI